MPRQTQPPLSVRQRVLTFCDQRWSLCSSIETPEPLQEIIVRFTITSCNANTNFTSFVYHDYELLYVLVLKH